MPISSVYSKTFFPSVIARWLVISFSSDWLFPPDQCRRIVDALIANNRPVSFCNVQTNCGHDAFLLEDNFASYGEMTRSFLDNLETTQTRAPALAEAAHGPNSIFRRHRLDYDRIVELVPREASVLDLGCGSGGLLSRLRSNGRRRLVGVELDEESVLASIRRGLDVVQSDLNQGLKAFSKDQFDCVILSQTLQTVSRVEALIDDMLRIGRTGIVSIPNFAYRPLRRMLAEEGRAPKSSGVLRNEWYNTPNIRFFTLADFEEFCRLKNIHVHKRIALDTECGNQGSLDELIAHLEQTHLEAMNDLHSLPDSELDQPRSTLVGNVQVIAWRWLMAMVEHEIHHRSQLATYLMLLGLTPPHI